MFIATDSLTEYAAVLVAEDIQARGGAAIDSLREQGWSLPRIEAYAARGVALKGGAE